MESYHFPGHDVGSLVEAYLAIAEEIEPIADGLALEIGPALLDREDYLTSLGVEQRIYHASDKDLIIAFFQEVPPAFKSMLERLLSQLNIDYSQYLGQGK